jgi:hypothetical protein
VASRTVLFNRSVTALGANRRPPRFSIGSGISTQCSTSAGARLFFGSECKPGYESRRGWAARRPSRRAPGAGSIGAFQKTVIWFIFLDFLDGAGGLNQFGGVTDDGQKRSDAVGIELQPRPAVETNIGILLLIAKLKMAAEGPSLTRLAETTTLVSMITRIVAPSA